MSDRSGQKPKGTMVRHAPDWFSDNLACAGFQFIETAPLPTNTWWSIALLNNDQTGRVYRVYGITVSSEGGGGCAFFFQQGAPGAQVAVAKPLRPDYAPPTGAIFKQEVTGSALKTNPFDTGPDFCEIGAGGFDSGTTISPFPLAIIPGGYSLVGVNLGSSTPGGIFFWYQLAFN